MGLGKSRAANRLAAWHALFAVRIFAAAAADRSQLKVFDKAQNGVFSILDPGLCSFTPVEFPHGALERKRAL